MPDDRDHLIETLAGWLPKEHRNDALAATRKAYDAGRAAAAEEFADALRAIRDRSNRQVIELEMSPNAPRIEHWADQIDAIASNALQANATQTPQALADYYTSQQLADELGIHRRTLRKMEERGEGPPKTLIGSKKVLYRKESVAEWLRDREAKPRRRYPQQLVSRSSTKSRVSKGVPLDIHDHE